MIEVREVIQAVRAEADLATAEVMGVGELVDIGVESSEEASSQTDEQFGDRDLEVTESDSAGVRLQLGAVAAQDREVPEVRSEVDALRMSVDLNAEAAMTAMDLYGRVISDLLDVENRLVEQVSTSTLRQGADLFSLGLHQVAALSDVVWSASLHELGGVDQTGELSGLLDELRDGRAELVEVPSASVYHQLSVDLVDAIDRAGYVEILAGFIDGSSMDLLPVLEAVGIEPREGWPGFLDQVSTIMGEES